jgi:hypothetical protein
MPISLQIKSDIYSSLLEHFEAREDEQVAFLFTEPPNGGPFLRVVEMYVVPASGFAGQSAYHVALTDEVRAHVISRASALGGCLIEAHSHPGTATAWFSPTDLDGFEEWVPHVRWRLRGRTYIALVFARGSFDALVWEEGTERPSRLAALCADERGMRPTGLTIDRLTAHKK